MAWEAGGLEDGEREWGGGGAKGMQGEGTEVREEGGGRKGECEGGETKNRRRKERQETEEWEGGQ